jgi:hypothetical protein
MAVVTPFRVAQRVLRVVTGYNFWHNATQRPYNFKARLLEAGKDILRAVFIPVYCVGKEILFLCGIINPKLAQEANKNLSKYSPY